MSYKDGAWQLPAKARNVLTPLVTAEKERDSFFCPFSLHMRCSLLLLGASGSFCIFLIITYNLIYLFFYFPIFYILNKTLQT